MEGNAPPTSSLLTVVITTSVTPSAPSTELLSSILESFCLHCPQLATCRVIVVLDGYDQIVAKARLKKGCVTAEQARDYGAYKQDVKNLILEQHYDDTRDIAFTQTQAEAEYGSPWERADNSVSYTITQTPDRQVTFIEPSRRLGFGLAVRSALRLTETPYVWIQQHDWALVAPFPITTALQLMKEREAHPDAPVKYICLPAVRTLSYTISPDVEGFPFLKEFTARFKGEYFTADRPEEKIPLTPMFFWHDKPHVAETRHYLERVFPTRLAVLRGDFIEDKIGQRARAQMKEGEWAKWGTWLYHPEDGKKLCLRHLHGRKWRGTEKEAEHVAQYRQMLEDKRACAPNDGPGDICGPRSRSSSIGDLDAVLGSLGFLEDELPDGQPLEPGALQGDAQTLEVAA